LINGWGAIVPLPYKEKIMKDKYFKRPNGDVVKYEPVKKHDLESFKARFVECDKDGKEKKAKK